jgi:hypothetical protein
MKTLKEKFDKVEIMFEGQTGYITYDELCEASNECEKIAEEFAIGFGDFCRNITSTHKHIIREYPDATTEELLKIYKKERGL